MLKVGKIKSIKIVYNQTTQMEELKNIDFFRIESSIWLAEKKTNVSAYDFQFEPIFKTERPRTTQLVNTIGRIGAIKDYRKLFDCLIEYGFKLVNTPKQHILSSELESWYPLIQELTPKSIIYEKFPTLEQLYQDFKFPIFIKGNRQTSKHNPELSIARDETDFIRIANSYQKDSILHWQKVVCRELISLKTLNHQAHGKVPISFEFRTFWWNSILVGAGHYWSQYLEYSWTDEQYSDAIAIANKAANKLNIPFLVIDLALTADNQWIIIECNDGQESGYCGVNPLKMWQKIIEEEKSKM